MLGKNLENVVMDRNEIRILQLLEHNIDEIELYKWRDPSNYPVFQNPREESVLMILYG